MKILLTLGIFFFALSFCNLAERLTGRQENVASQSNSNTAAANSNPASTAPSTDEIEKPSLTEAQRALLAGGTEMKWDEQGMAWTLPRGWRRLSRSQTLFNYGSADGAFLIVNVSPMAADFPVEPSIRANYDGAVTRQKNGELEMVRYLELDGSRGVEFIETMPEDKTGARRHQWLGFRKYAGQVQMLNIMLSTTGANFEKNRDAFAAVMASTKITK